MITLELPGVYRIVDWSSGRFYIGSSVNIAARWRQHQYRMARGIHPNPILQNIWSKASTRLTIEILQVTTSQRDDLLRAEQAHIDAAQGDPLCMNVLRVAGSHLGRKRSAATRAALAAASRGRKASPEAKAKMRAAKVGRKLTEEHKRKIGDAGRGKTYVRKTEAPRLTLRKLTSDQVIELRKKRASGMSWRLLGIEAKLNASVAKRAVLGITYADVVA